MSSSDSSDSQSGSPLKQIKLSQQITKHPGRFLGSGTSLTGIERYLANGTQTPKHVKTTPGKRLSKFSPVRFMKAPPLQPKNIGSNGKIPANRGNVTKKLFDDEGVVLDPLFDEDWIDEPSNRVRSFTDILLSVLGDSSTFHLIDPAELNVVSKFLNMPSHCKELYIQMFNRKHKWHLVSDIKYALNMTEMFNELESYGFVTSDLMLVTLDELLEILKVSDLQLLCKEFKLKPGGKAKSDLMKALMKYSRCQRTLVSNNSTYIKSKISKLAGHCIKLCDNQRELFKRINFLFSVPFSDGDNVGDLSHQNSLHVSFVENGKMVYPTYDIVKTMPIFASVEALMKYEEAILMEIELSGIIKRKDLNILKTFAMKAWDHFKGIIQDSSEQEQATKLPIYLRCFTAGSVYTRILFSCARYLKRDGDLLDDAVKIIEDLLNQNVYEPQCRGDWYDLLVSMYNPERPLAATKAVMLALRDPELDEIDRCNISNRGSRLLARKKPLPEKTRSNLLKVIKEPPEKPAVNVIEAKSLQNNKQGFKLIYIQEDGAKGMTYSSVEELVISHYRKLGYSRGMHAENKFIISIFGLVFWDIIYEHTVPDVFQNQYQYQPLDLKTKLFYINRKEVIDARLAEMETWTVDDIRSLVIRRVNEHRGKLSIVYWNLFSNVQEGVELLDCIGVHVLNLLCDRVAKSYRMASRGFPDLVLWTPGQKEMCRFVEVKGQGDSLSSYQKVWLDYLVNIGADAEVCHVRRVVQKRTVK